MGLGDVQPAGGQEPHRDVLLQMTAGKQIHACALEGERCQANSMVIQGRSFLPKGLIQSSLKLGVEEYPH